MRESPLNKISESMRGRFGPDSRRWKGHQASYYAKHMWILKHYGTAKKCSKNPNHKAKRYEWANISGEYKRDISDYIELCPSCHRKMDADRRSLVRGNGKKVCKNKHELSDDNTYVDPRGYRQCKECMKEARRRWREKRERNKISNMG